MFLAILLFSSYALAAQYEVMVGFDDPSIGLSQLQYTPKQLVIQVGDTVLFKQNSQVEPHTVTFLPAGMSLPSLTLPNSLTINPNASEVFTETPYMGDAYLNSGIMIIGSQNTQFSVTFGAEGTFNFYCIVHGTDMHGIITVVKNHKKIEPPKHVLKSTRKQFKSWKKMAAHVSRKIKAPPPQSGSGGSVTHTVIVGADRGVLNFNAFFPRTLEVKLGDTVCWTDSIFHTVTFMNGATPYPLLTLLGGTTLSLNPAVFTPSGGATLSTSGVFNSGVLTNPTDKYCLTMGATGKFQYECLVHKFMDGEIIVS